MGGGEWKSRAHPFPLITGFCICHFIDINENEKEILSRESIGKSVLLFPFFYAFFWSAYYDCQKKTNGKQKIFSCKKSVCEVSENTKNSGNRE